MVGVEMAFVGSFASRDWAVVAVTRDFPST